MVGGRPISARRGGGRSERSLYPLSSLRFSAERCVRVGARIGGGVAGGDSNESGDRLGDAGAAQDRSSDSNCARLDDRESEALLVGELARSRRRRLAGHAHSRSDSLSHSEPDGNIFYQHASTIRIILLALH